VSYGRLKKMGALFLILFLIQLKYSKKARIWTKNIGYLTVYIASVVGLLTTASTLAVKYKLDKTAEKVNKQPVALPLAFTDSEQK
jgi:hypothetical protein